MKEIRLFLLVFELSFWAVYGYQSDLRADAGRVVACLGGREAPRKPLPEPGAARQPQGESRPR